jgi:hypothetical protein
MKAVDLTNLYILSLARRRSRPRCEIILAVPNSAPDSLQFRMHLGPHRSRFQLEFIRSRDYVRSIWRMIKTDAN